MLFLIFYDVGVFIPILEIEKRIEANNGTNELQEATVPHSDSFEDTVTVAVKGPDLFPKES